MPKKKTKVQITDEQFSRNFVGNGFNALQAYKEMKPQVSTKTAGVLGSRKLEKVEVQNEVLRILEEDLDFGDKEQMSILKRNATQNVQIGASNTAIEVIQKMKSSFYAKQGINLSLNIAQFLDTLDNPPRREDGQDT